MIRLLIADDEKLEREALADMVSRRFEHEVVLELAENGRKAADTAVLWGADLILMDIEMPGMSGLDAARAALEKLAGLDSSFPGIVRGCARDSANVERRLWAEREAQAEEDMRAWGVEVTTLSEAEMQKFRAAVRPMYERFAEQAELIRQIQEA